MTQEELRSYRLTSMEEPTDEMLQAIMEQVAESARRLRSSFSPSSIGGLSGSEHMVDPLRNHSNTLLN